jgi:hypothetical protein
MEWGFGRLVRYRRTGHSSLEPGTNYQWEEWSVHPGVDGPAPEGSVALYADSAPGWRTERLVRLLQDLMFYRDHKLNRHDTDDFRRVWRDAPSSSEHLASLRIELPERARAGRQILFRIGDASQLALSGGGTWR